MRRVDPKGECAFLVLLVGNGSSGMQWHDTEADAREAAEQLESSCEHGETVYLLRALSMSEEERDDDGPPPEFGRPQGGHRG